MITSVGVVRYGKVVRPAAPKCGSADKGKRSFGSDCIRLVKIAFIQGETGCCGRGVVHLGVAVRLPRYERFPAEQQLLAARRRPCLPVRSEDAFCFAGASKSSQNPGCFMDRQGRYCESGGGGKCSILLPITASALSSRPRRTDITGVNHSHVVIPDSTPRSRNHGERLITAFRIDCGSLPSLLK